MYRAILDTGVLIAALLSAKGAPAALLRRWLAGDYELIVSPRLLAELERVLLRPKFRPYLGEEDATEYADLFRRLATVVPDPPEEPGLTPDPGDDDLVSVARVAQADCLVSGDSPLTGLADPHPPVLTPRAFLERL